MAPPTLEERKEWLAKIESRLERINDAAKTLDEVFERTEWTVHERDVLRQRIERLKRVVVSGS